VVQQHVLQVVQQAAIGIVKAVLLVLIETIAAAALVIIAEHVFTHTHNTAADTMLCGQETLQDN
jgi:hypothetical protein